MIRALVPPNAPGDTSDTVGEGDGSDVMATSLGGTKGPGLERVRLSRAVSRQESGPCSVYEQDSEIAVAPFGDRTETPGGACGGLLRREAEVVGKAAA